VQQRWLNNILPMTNDSGPLAAAAATCYVAIKHPKDCSMCKRTLSTLNVLAALASAGTPQEDTLKTVFGSKALGTAAKRHTASFALSAYTVACPKEGLAAISAHITEAGPDEKRNARIVAAGAVRLLIKSCAASETESPTVAAALTESGELSLSSSETGTKEMYTPRELVEQLIADRKTFLFNPACDPESVEVRKIGLKAIGALLALHDIDKQVLREAADVVLSQTLVDKKFVRIISVTDKEEVQDSGIDIRASAFTDLRTLLMIAPETIAAEKLAKAIASGITDKPAIFDAVMEILDKVTKNQDLALGILRAGANDEFEPALSSFYASNKSKNKQGIITVLKAMAGVMALYNGPYTRNLKKSVLDFAALVGTKIGIN